MNSQINIKSWSIVGLLDIDLPCESYSGDKCKWKFRSTALTCLTFSLQLVGNASCIYHILKNQLQMIHVTSVIPARPESAHLQMPRINMGKHPDTIVVHEAVVQEGESCQLRIVLSRRNSCGRTKLTGNVRSYKMSILNSHLAKTFTWEEQHKKLKLLLCPRLQHKSSPWKT